MKPTKNRYFCKDVRRTKMLFKTEKEANTFIKFNAVEIEDETGKKPERSYHCIVCDGWHVTSKRQLPQLKSKTEMVIEQYHIEIEEKKKKADAKMEKKVKIKELILKETESKKEKLNQLFKSIELNVEMINILNSVNNTDKCIEILNYSYSLLQSFDTILLELEEIYKGVIIAQEMKQIIYDKRKQKHEINDKLDIIKESLRLN